MAVDISHVNDSIALGDGTDVVVLEDVSGTMSLPVKVMGSLSTGDASNAVLTGGTVRTKITDGTNNAGLTNVGGNYALKVDVVQTTGGGAGGTSSTDSAAFTAASSSFTPTGGAFDDVSSDALAEGEMGIVRLTSGRAMHVAVQNSVAVTGTFYQATQPVSAASLPLPSGAATEATLASLLTSSQLLDDMIATLGSAIPTKGSLIAGSDGTNARAVKVDSSGELQVDVLTMPTVAVTGTFWQATQPVSGTVTANLAAGTNNIGDVDVLTLPALPAGTNNIGDVDVLTLPGIAGTVAHDGADSGNPVKIGGVARTADPTAVATGDRVDAYFDVTGKQVVTPYAPRALTVTGAATLTNTTATSLITAGGAGIFVDLTTLILTNTSSTAVRVDIRDAGTGGSVIFSIGLAANGGAVVNFPAPVPQTTANNAWAVQLSASVTDVRCYGIGVKRVG
jgi:hypothetical protein